MQAFRKWWEHSKWYFNNSINAHWVRRGWAGALKEVLKRMDTSNSGGAGLKHRQTIDWIKEELKDA